MDNRDRREERSAEPSLAETIEGAGRRISMGLVIGGAAIALALYSRAGPPRYAVDVAGSTVIRTDVRSGTVLACEGQRCYVVVRRGQSLEDEPLPKALPAPQPQPQQKALPAPPPTAEPADN